MKKILLALFFIMILAIIGWGQVSLVNTGQAYIQNFNSLANSGTTNTWTDNLSIQGWYSNRISFVADDGSSTTGGLHSYGTTLSTERALGALTSSTASIVYFGIRLVNNTGVCLTSFEISFTGEQWRQTANQQSLIFEHQVGAASLTSGTWTADPVLDFTGPKTGTAGSLNGNTTGNFQIRTSTLNINVPVGGEIWFRWTKSGLTSPGLSIDDFSVTAYSSGPDACDLPALFFSEYIEGSSNNKAIEIYNGSHIPTDLSKCSVKLYPNGSVSAGNTWSGPSGSIEAGDCYILYNSGSAGTIPAAGNETSGVCTYNGDDALELLYDGQPVDVIGIIGNDPGTGWTVAGVANATADRTLLRKLDITGGSTNWAASAGSNSNDSQWVIKNNDYCGNLGEYGTAWTGNVDTCWNVDSNWDMGCPSDSINVIIPSTGNLPQITTSPGIRRLYIKDGGVLSVWGSLTCNGKTTLKGQECLIIRSDATLTGSFIDHGFNSTGTSSVERFLSMNKWHYVCFPVTISESEIFSEKYLMYYMENEHHYRYIISADSSWISSAKGFSVWSDGVDAIISYKGNLNTGNISQDVTRSWNLLSNECDGYNLTGNPYPSSLDLNSSMPSWTNVEQTAWFWDPLSGNYKVFVKEGVSTHSEFAQPCQGFFVHCSAPASQFSQGTGSVYFNNSSRTHHDESFLKGSEPEKENLMITLSSDNTTYNDQAVIYFDPVCTENYDTGRDAQKLPGLAEAPQLYFPAGNEKLTVNGIPFSRVQITVPLGLTLATETMHMLTVYNVESFDNRISIFLEDTKHGKMQDIRKDPVYKFNSGPGDYPAMFKLHFNNPFLGSDDDLIRPSLKIISSERKIIVESGHLNPDGKIFLFSADGRLINVFEIKDSTTVISPDIQEGLYLIRVISGDESVVTKILFK